MKNYQYIEILSVAVIGVLFASVGIKNVFLAALLSGSVQLGSTILLRTVFHTKIKLSPNINLNLNNFQSVFGVTQLLVSIYLIYLMIDGQLIDAFIENISTFEGKLTDKDFDAPIFSISSIKIGFQVLFSILCLLIMSFSIKNFIKSKNK